MPLTNLNSAHLTQAQVTAAQNATTALEDALSMITVSLNAEDCSKYGSINEQNKLLVNKVKDYRSNSPQLSAPDMDWEEFERDFASRAFLEGLISRLEAINVRLNGAKILHDYDNYQAALEDYAYTSYRAGSGAAGYETKRNEMKQFFNRSGKTVAPPDTNP